jgi:hypothetical protein
VAIYRYTRDRKRQSGSDCYYPAEIHALFSLGAGSPDDDIFDLYRVQVASSSYDFLNGLGGKALGSCVPQSSPARSSNCRACTGYDYCLTHFAVPFIAC